MDDESSISDRSSPASQNVRGKFLDLPPPWFLVGSYVGLAILIAGNYLVVGNARLSWNGIGELIAAVLAGSLLLLGIFGTAMEICAKSATGRLEGNLRSRRQLFAYGMAFAFLATLLTLGIFLGLGLVVDSLPLASVRANVTGYIVALFASLALSTAIVMRLLALWSRGKNV